MTNSAEAVTPRAPDIYLVGLGVKSVQQMTLEAIGYLRLCRQVFTVDHGFGVKAFLAELGPEIIDLIPEYRTGQHRLITYQTMAARVVDAAMAQGPVAFATYGHPNWLVFPTELILEAAAHLDLVTMVVPGVSSLDTLFADLAIDPAPQGLQIYEASGLVAGKMPINPAVPAVILQVDAFSVQTYEPRRIDAETLAPFIAYLLRFYPPEHEIVSVYSSTHPLVRPVIRRFAIAQLATVFGHEAVSGTLYIPALRPG